MRLFLLGTLFSALGHDPVTLFHHAQLHQHSTICQGYRSPTQTAAVRGSQFLTPLQDRGAEIRCYLRDPDGHLIEVGQTVSAPIE